MARMAKKETVPVDPERETLWDKFLAGLAPWELHWMKNRELGFHDLFVTHTLELEEVEALITAAFSEIAKVT